MTVQLSYQVQYFAAIIALECGWELSKISIKFELWQKTICEIDGLMQERCNSSANALELHLSCTKLSEWPLYDEYIYKHYSKTNDDVSVIPLI